MFAFARKLLRQFRKARFQYEPLLEVRIYSDAIRHNIRLFRSLNENVAVAPVLKSNAYGHGLLQIADIVETERVPFLCVDSFFEALILRNEGIRTPLLIIGYTPLVTVLESRLFDVAFGVISMDDLHELAKNARTSVAIHLKIDSGMHRHGIQPSEINEAIGIVQANQRLRLEGVYSHLADADTKDSKHTAKQVEVWNDAAKSFRSAFPNIRYFHLAATAGATSAKKADANVARLGLGLYGINSGPAGLALRPALEMRTGISSIKSIQKGESIGYNATFTAPNDMCVATIPAGYYEGIDRRLSSKGTVLVRNTVCPILGRVSMNITSFDVTHVPDVHAGERVIIVSADDTSPNSVETIARTCETIPYEILVHIPSHLRRVVV